MLRKKNDRKSRRVGSLLQVVGSGVLHIVMRGNPEKGCLVRVLEPLLKKLSPGSWDVLHLAVMWNVRKPVWFQVRG